MPAAPQATGERIPVTVLTGFLGAGKTTLVKRILQAEHGERIAVIENELSDVDIDGELILRVEEEIVVMTNGCLCCAVRDDLIGAVRRLLDRPDAPERILVETTGLAEPGPIAQTFFADPELRNRVALDAIVTVVDALNLPRQLDAASEAREQIAFADVLLLNKADLVSAERLRELESLLRSINATARIHKTTAAAIELSEVLDLGAFSLRATDLSRVEGPSAQHESGIGAVGIDLPGELNPALLYRWIGDLLGLRGPDLFRLKGVLAIAGVEDRVVIQGVHRLVDSGLDARWDEEPRHSKLVLIGRNLDGAEIETGIRACLETSGTNHHRHIERSAG